MVFDPGLEPGATIDNARLVELFKCGNQGGMRRSLSTGTPVLVANHVESVYHDRWLGDVFHITGMGLQGDQSLNFMQNPTLAESNVNGVDVHLFEVHNPYRYTYVGRVRLAGKPYEEQQPDESGSARCVWIFPVKLVDGSVPAVSEEEYDRARKRNERRAQRLSDQELEVRASVAPAVPGRRIVASVRFARSADVAEDAKRRAKGACQLCDQPAPFINKHGDPFLEAHHVVWLSRGGTDSIDNTVALCPNCHRRTHILDRDTDREKLSKAARSPR